MRSTSSRTLPGGEGVNLDTVSATAKLMSIPTVPIPSGEIPNHQFSGESAAGLTKRK